MLQMRERSRQVRFECRNELPACCDGSIVGAAPTNKNNAGSERISIDVPNPTFTFCSDRPRTSYGKSYSDRRIEKCVPPRARGTVVTVGFSLLESIVNGNGESRMRLL